MTLSLRTKLTLAFGLVAAVPLAILQQGASRILRDDYVERARSELQQSRRLVEQRLGQEGSRMATELAELTADLDLRGALLGVLSPGPQQQRLAAQRELIDALKTASARTTMRLLGVYGTDGVVLGLAQEPQRFWVPGVPGVPAIRDQRVLDEVCAHPSQPVVGREQGIRIRGLALRVCLPLTPRPNGAERLWLVGGVLVDAGFLDRLSVAPSSPLVVVDDDGVRTTDSDGGRAAAAILARSAGDHVRALAAAGWETEPIRPRDLVVAEPTRLFLATSRAPLLAALAEQARFFTGLLLGGLLVAWVLALVLSRHWSTPVERLVAALERVGRGDLSARVGLERRDELGRLGHAFDRMTSELAESRERLVQAERVAAWRDIARRLAHEIKNPLSPIALSMETLQRYHAAGRPEFPELLEESTRTVLEEVERLRRIVQEFSDFARLPKPRLVEESFHEVVRSVLALHAGLDRHRFVTDLEPGEARFTFDPDQMSRLLTNLLQNATEAMPDGGEIRIATRTDRRAGRFVLRVEDDGPGIPAAAVDDLFQPYRTTKEGGTGLGLAIVQRIAAEHGGTVRLTNPGAPGGGASFEVVLPLAPPDETEPSAS